MREALEISAIVVNHVILPNPPEPSTANSVQPLRLPSPVGGGGGGEGGDGVEIPIMCGERSFGPVGFDEAASGCPLVGIPEA